MMVVELSGFTGECGRVSWARRASLNHLLNAEGGGLRFH